MPRFLVIHRITRLYATQDAWLQDWAGLRKRARGSNDRDARWRVSWFAPRSSRLYCEWEAPDEASIRACFNAQELTMAPIETVDEVVFADPAWLDQD